MIEYIDCLSIANRIKDGIREKLNGASPLLRIARYQATPDDEIYIKGVKKDAEELGFRVTDDPVVNPSGVLLIGKEYWNDFTSFKELDVDGVTDASPYIPAVAQATNEIINSLGGAAGKVATVIGRGVGSAIAGSLIAQDATVAIAHSKTTMSQMESILFHSDIVVCAARGASFSTNLLPFEHDSTLIDIGNCFTLFPADEIGSWTIRMTPRKNGIGVITRAVLLDRVADNYLNENRN